MKSLLSILPFLLETCNKGRVWKTEDGALSHVFEELHHTFLGEITCMQDAGFIKQFLFHVQVVTPITCLQEGAVVLKPGLEETA